ncbi:MAG: class II fructose-bisphosphatase [Rickettsiales bacterium]|nr:class II fructose-bisphosphatase [Rickettsiales bacterium]
MTDTSLATKLDSNILLEAIRVTEAAAIAAYSMIGRGDEKKADEVAVNAMRSALAQMNIEGTVVIGEGERDKAPMLYVGEKVGTGNGPKIDIALDPLEGTTICATGGLNSMSVIAMTEAGGLLNAPDVYMEKIAIGERHNSLIIDLDDPIKKNLANLAKLKKCSIEDLTVVVLDRPRHEELIAKIREAGSRIQLIKDGDIAAVIATALPNTAVDMYVGIGGAPEGVLAAAALSTTGGQMMSRLKFDDEIQKTRAYSMGISDLNHKYIIDDMAKGEDIMFVATGVTSGSLLEGVKKLKNGGVRTNSISMSSKHKAIRYIKTEHIPN